MQSANFTASRHRFRSTFLACVLVFVAYSVNSQVSSACSLLQTSELESALGGKAGAFTDHALGSNHMCNGPVGDRQVLIRVAERKDKSGNKEISGIELLRKQGWQVNVKTEGSVTCSTAAPPDGSEYKSFNTTCTLFQNGKVVAVEVTSRAKSTMASMDVVRGLVQKAFSRL